MDENLRSTPLDRRAQRGNPEEDAEAQRRRPAGVSARSARINPTLQTAAAAEQGRVSPSGVFFLSGVSWMRTSVLLPRGERTQCANQ